MNVIELEKFNSFILDFQISPFENSSDCVLILTRNQLIIGFIAPTKELKWTIFKEIDMKNDTTAVTLSPLSRTLLMPLLVRTAYADKTGIYIHSFVEDSCVSKQTVLKGDFEVTTMCYNDDGMKLAFSGFDNNCHVLVYQDDALSEPDSIISDEVSEGSYHHCIVKLTSPGISVKWHPTKNNYLVVAELNGIIRFLVSSSSSSEDEKENFTCEYTINLGLKLCLPLTDIDFIVTAGVESDTVSYDFIVSCSSGLFLFALDKPLASLKKMPNGSSCSSGNLRVKLSSSWGYGSMLATIGGGSNRQISITDLEASRVINSSVIDCVAIGWHKQRAILLAATTNTLVGIDFTD